MCLKLFQRESLANEPHMTLPFQDPTVFYDAVKLVSLVSKRQTGVTEEEVWRFKWLLQSVMENVFRIPYIKQEIDADEGGTVEVTFNGFIV